MRVFLLTSPPRPALSRVSPSLSRPSGYHSLCQLGCANGAHRQRVRLFLHCSGLWGHCSERHGSNSSPRGLQSRAGWAGQGRQLRTVGPLPGGGGGGRVWPRMEQGREPHRVRRDHRECKVGVGRGAPRPGSDRMLRGPSLGLRSQEARSYGDSGALPSSAPSWLCDLGPVAPMLSASVSPSGQWAQ